jgi:hypothetical protein
VLNTPGTSSKSPHIEVIQLPVSSDRDDGNNDTYANVTHLLPSTNPTYHIYSKHPCHKLISPVSDPSKDRRSGPTLKEQKAIRKDKKLRAASGLPSIEPDDNAFFIHKPYLAFHMAPHVLYTGNSSRGTTPTVLIHQACFWRGYKLQILRPEVAEEVLDPRGVVGWKHNGGDKKALNNDDKLLKGYKVRTWRLWGETGKSYVHGVKKTRRTGAGATPTHIENESFHVNCAPTDPDVLPKAFKPARADETIYLRWSSPFSTHTRRYHFSFRNINFYWKGTGTVKETRRCGMFLRYNHLKLVAQIPLIGDEKGAGFEICLAKYTSSIAKQKHGVLELFDTAILRLAEEHAPTLLNRQCDDERGLDGVTVKVEDEEGSDTVVDRAKDEIDGLVEHTEEMIMRDGFEEKTARLKRSTLYQVIMATAICMIMSEKEKRHTLIDLILQSAEGGGGAGG